MEQVQETENRSNMKECKVCGKLREHKPSGRYKSLTNFIKYRDDDNLLWNGRTCGLCNRKRAAQTMSSLRKQREIDGDEI